MDKDRFHNEFTVCLGRERVVRDLGIYFVVGESGDPWVTLSFFVELSCRKVQGFWRSRCYRVSNSVRVE